MKTFSTRLLALGLVCTLGFTPACGDDHDDHNHGTDTVTQTDTTTPDDTATPEDTATPDDTATPEDTGPAGPGNLAEVATEAGNFTTLLAAVEAAGLSGVVATQGPFTVLAPTDDAFAKLPEGTVEDLLKEENKDMLTGILTYHVINGTVSSEEVKGMTEAETLSGAMIAIEVVDGEVIINGSAKVTTADIPASNGVIHVIDTVLMPPAPAEEYEKLELWCEKELALECENNNYADVDECVAAQTAGISEMKACTDEMMAYYNCIPADVEFECDEEGDAMPKADACDDEALALADQLDFPILRDCSL